MQSHQAISDLLKQLVDSYPQRATDLRDALLKSGLKESIVAKLLKLRVGKPQPDDLMIPSLVEGQAIRTTAMLEARFRFAGSMEDIAGHFLSIKEMGALVGKKKFLELYKAQAENWAGSAAATVPAQRLSVFSVRSLEDGDLTYIVWPSGAKSEQEPQLWEYAGQSETRYKHLQAYLEHLCG